MGFSVVTLRGSQWRPEVLDSGAIIMTGINPNNLLRSIGLELSGKGDSFLSEGYALNIFSHKVLK
jgi:UDP-N-acetylglucosamine 2-epimerase (non-hydrolysing)